MLCPRPIDVSHFMETELLAKVRVRLMKPIPLIVESNHRVTLLQSWPAAKFSSGVLSHKSMSSPSFVPFGEPIGSQDSEPGDTPSLVSVGDSGNAPSLVLTVQMSDS